MRITTACRPLARCAEPYTSTEEEVLAGLATAGVSSTRWPPRSVPPRRYGQPEGSYLDRRAFLGTLTGSLLGPPLAAEAQQAGKIYRVGYVRPFGIGPIGLAFNRSLRDSGL
jgi:hypothetical protein